MGEFGTDPEGDGRHDATAEQTDQNAKAANFPQGDFTEEDREEEGDLRLKE